MEIKKIRFGIVGVGEVATLRLLPALLTLEHATLHGIVSRDPPRAKELCKKFNATEMYVTYEAMLDDPKIDAVIIATPDKLHAKMAIAALQARKHVFIEKPMATDPADAHMIVEVARIYDKKVAVGYHLRHHAGHQALSCALMDGAIGSPRHVRILWSYTAPPHDWRATTELGRWWAIAAVGTHALDLATWFLDETTLPVTQTTRQCDEGMLEHSATIDLHWANEKSAEIIVSNRMTLPRLIEISGSHGSARAHDTLAAYGKGRISINDHDLHFIPIDPYRAELHDFVTAIMDGREPIVNGAIGLHNVDLLHLLT